MVKPSAEFWRGKRVLITGHTGFKGSWLALLLQDKGALVTGLALPPPSNPSHFTAINLKELVTHHECDIRDFALVKKIISEARPEIVFHLAAQALVRPSYADPIGTYATNVMGTVHVLEALRSASGTRVVINVTSDKCYENREWEWGYREGDPLGGFDPYSSSKGCAEIVASAYRRSYFQAADLRLASVRAGNVIGGGDWAEDRLIPDAMRAFSRGQPVTIRMPGATRPWQHVLEPLHGYMLVAERLWDDARFAESWNFGPNDLDSRSVRVIIDRASKIWGSGAAWIDASGKEKGVHEAKFLKLDCSKANARLGWWPLLNVEQALEMTVEWYRAYYSAGGGGGSGKKSAREWTLGQIHHFDQLRLQKNKKNDEVGL